MFHKVVDAASDCSSTMWQRVADNLNSDASEPSAGNEDEKQARVHHEMVPYTEEDPWFSLIDSEVNSILAQTQRRWTIKAGLV